MLLAGYGYYFYVSHRPCASPISYKIGIVDPRFGVSRSQFEDDISEASTLWGSSIGRTLFMYDPHGEVTINLVYDTRQQTTQAEGKLRVTIDQGAQTAASAKAQYQASQAKYLAAKQDYTSALAQLTKAQDAYDAQVQTANSRGGASPGEFASLQTEKQALQVRSQDVEAKRQEVNTLAQDTNTLIDQYNSLVDNVNEKVQTFNNDGLAGTQFEEGVYVSDDQGRHIDIYQFDTQTAFIRVIAHELGHALGLDHNNNPDSIMNPVNQSTSMVLSSDDLQALQTECGL